MMEPYEEVMERFAGAGEPISRTAAQEIASLEAALATLKTKYHRLKIMINAEYKPLNVVQREHSVPTRWGYQQTRR